MRAVVQTLSEWLSWFTRDRLLVIIPSVIALTGIATLIFIRLDPVLRWRTGRVAGRIGHTASQTALGSEM